MRPAFHPPIPRKSHLRRAGWDYGGVDGRDRAARRQSGTLLRVTVGVVGQAGLSPDSPSVRGLGFPARHRAATSAPSCRSCPNRALFESCTSPSFARSADHIRSHSCIPPLYKHLYKHHRRLTRRMFRGHPRTVTQNPRSVTTGRNIEHRPAVWRGNIFGSRRARHHPQLTGRAARSRLSPHARRLTDASRCPSAKTHPSPSCPPGLSVVLCHSTNRSSRVNRASSHPCRRAPFPPRPFPPCLFRCILFRLPPPRRHPLIWYTGTLRVQIAVIHNCMCEMVVFGL